MSEIYDEVRARFAVTSLSPSATNPFCLLQLIFTDPDPTFAKRLSTKVMAAGKQSALARYDASLRPHFRKFDEAEEEKQIKRVRRVCRSVMHMTGELRDRLTVVRKEIKALEDDIRGMGAEPEKAKPLENPSSSRGQGSGGRGRKSAPAPAPTEKTAAVPEVPEEPEEPQQLGRGQRKGGRKRQKR